MDRYLSAFSKKHKLLHESLHGLEKESLRTNLKGQLSCKPHPKILGSALYHKEISLDFAEAQLELITKPHSTAAKALDQLFELHQIVYHHLDKEMLWPSSMPCSLVDEGGIQLAQFGFTKEGYLKELYRLSLARRYGKKMQMLSGVHYNFSFKESFWKHLQVTDQSKDSLSDYISEKYLALSRNYLRWGWMISYLFGASPVAGDSYFKEQPKELLKRRMSIYSPFATSIRMSQYGYFSKIQSQVAVLFNSLKEYRQDLQKALNTKHPFFERLGLCEHGKPIQINENILQIEAEHYSRIRPKAHEDIKQRPIDALEQGVAYFEVRNIDIDPLIDGGIDLQMLQFLHIFFVYCLFKKSSKFDLDEAKTVCQNQSKVALNGLKPNLRLTQSNAKSSITIKKWMLEILEDMEPIVYLMGQHNPHYLEAFYNQIDKVNNPSLCPAAKQLEVFQQKKMTFDEFACGLARKHRRFFLKKPPTEKVVSTHRKKARSSHKSLADQELQEEDVLHGYEEMEPSTQMVIKEAYRRGWRVDIIDRKENLVVIDNGENRRLIQQATQTELDSLMSYLMMKNKYVTQRRLNEEGLQTTLGKRFENAKQAIAGYSEFQSKKVVVKPNQANFGKGIVFVEPYEDDVFQKAVKDIEKSQDQILIEPFFPGDEYRFLVIGDRVCAVAKRTPPYVIGDGKQTIQQLIESKNSKNAHRKAFQKPIAIDKALLLVLQNQDLKINSRLKSRQKVFLRSNSNVTTGGESFDVTDQVHPGYLRIAKIAAKACLANICGVDLLIEQLKDAPTKKNYAVIEVNHNPALFIHRFPSKGQKKYVEKDVLNYLFNQPLPTDFCK